LGRPQRGVIELLGFQAGVIIGEQMLNAVNLLVGPFRINIVITNDCWSLWFDSTINPFNIGK
jgi:hypothetical protein